MSSTRKPTTREKAASDRRAKLAASEATRVRSFADWKAQQKPTEHDGE